jgi:hypothetical protein
MSSVSVPFNQIAASGTRAEVLASISLTTTTSSSSTNPPCSLRYALETFDTATGATHVYVNGGAEGGGPGGFGGGPGQGR